jgi:hypothetical protein
MGLAEPRCGIELHMERPSLDKLHPSPIHCYGKKRQSRGLTELAVLEKTYTLRMAGHSMLTPAQLRAARALVGWTRDDRWRSGVFSNTILQL